MVDTISEFEDVVVEEQQSKAEFKKIKPEEESIESVKSIPDDYKFEVGAEEDEEPASVESVKSIPPLNTQYFDGNTKEATINQPLAVQVQSPEAPADKPLPPGPNTNGDQE